MSGAMMTKISEFRFLTRLPIFVVVIITLAFCTAMMAGISWPLYFLMLLLEILTTIYSCQLLRNTP
jgi:hypothetical protein